MAKKLLSNLTVNNETLYMYDEDAYHGTVPTKTSDLQNDSGFIDNTVNDLTNYYTETQTDTLLSAKAPNEPTFSEASTRDNLAGSGESTSTIFGKIKKWFSDLKAVAFSGSFNDLSDQPTIPTVNDAKLIIQKNGTQVAQFTANQSGNDVTANVTVPTATSDLTNDSNFVADSSYVHTDNNYTTTEKTKLSGIESGAEVNQNAFSNVKVTTGIGNPTIIEADSKTDTLELVAGNNITLTPDATNDKITINGAAGFDMIYVGDGTDHLDAYPDNVFRIMSTGATTCTLYRDALVSGFLCDAIVFESPDAVSTSAAGLCPALPNEALPSTPKFLRQDGTWQVPSGSGSGLVTGVKGSHESVYRTGDVSLSATDVEALPIVSPVLNKQSLVIKDETSDSSPSGNYYFDIYHRQLNSWEEIDGRQGVRIAHDRVAFYTSGALVTAGGNGYLTVDFLEGLKFYNTGLPNDPKKVVLDDSYVHTDNNYTTTEKNKLTGIASGAEVNQNAFSNVKVGSTTVAADSKTDTLELVAGSNITLTPDATNDKVTISASSTVAWGGITGTLSNQTDLQTALDGKVSYRDGGIELHESGYDVKIHSDSIELLRDGVRAFKVDSWGELFADSIADGSHYLSDLDDKQDTLVSGTNIKTINNTSLLGSGNVAVQPTLVSGTNIKTVNSTSLLGSGNISVQPTLVSGTNIKTINNTSLLGSGNISISASPDVLWTNPSPTANFGAQTITLSKNISNYTYYEIIYIWSASAATQRFNSTGHIPIAKGTFINVCTNRNYWRAVEAPSGTSLEFQQGQYYTTYGSSGVTAANGNCVPYMVLGWK